MIAMKLTFDEKTWISAYCKALRERYRAESGSAFRKAVERDAVSVL